MSEKLVSVVITCFNYGRYLKACLDSVLAQTYPHIEIVVIDDGSTDETASVIEPFRGLPNLQYFWQKNAGQARAKNAGIAKTGGDFVAFLDADDLWTPTKIEKQVRCFEDPAVGVAFSTARYIDADNKMVDFQLAGKYLQPRRGAVTRWLVFDNFVPFSSSMVRAECLRAFHGFDESLAMGIDWDLWLRISTRHRFDYEEEPLCHYRIGHPGQMSKNQEERHRCSDRIMEKFLKNYPEAVSPAILRQASAYTACVRGNDFRRVDRRRSYAYFLRALRDNPMETDALKGVLKNLLNWQG